MKEFLSENSIYIVFIILLVIWGGIFLFINSIEARVKKIENEIESDENEK